MAVVHHLIGAVIVDWFGGVSFLKPVHIFLNFRTTEITDERSVARDRAMNLRHHSPMQLNKELNIQLNQR